jgi:hypothetical protein
MALTTPRSFNNRGGREQRKYRESIAPRFAAGLVAAEAVD